jgi:hypothetical protein
MRTLSLVGWRADESETNPSRSFVGLVAVEWDGLPFAVSPVPCGVRGRTGTGGSGEGTGRGGCVPPGSWQLAALAVPSFPPLAGHGSTVHHRRVVNLCRLRGFTTSGLFVIFCEMRTVMAATYVVDPC